MKKHAMGLHRCCDRRWWSSETLYCCYGAHEAGEWGRGDRRRYLRKRAVGKSGQD